MNIGIIIGSTRPGRKADRVARWIHEKAVKRADAEYTIVDIADYNLPLLDEPKPPASGVYEKEHTRRWAAAIAALDAFVFVTPEYNHSPPAALKNAVDFLNPEWADKAACVVSYGWTGGARAAKELRAVLTNVGIANVRPQVALSLATDFAKDGTFTPAPLQERLVTTMLDKLLAWTTALRPLRK